MMLASRHLGNGPTADTCTGAAAGSSIIAAMKASAAARTASRAVRARADRIVRTIPAVKPRATFRATSVVGALAVLVGCTTVTPPSVNSPGATPTAVASPSASAPPSSVAPSPTPTAPSTFPLAVVTGLTNLKSTISLDELDQLAARNRLLVPCGIEVADPALVPPARCRPADRVAVYLEEHQQRVALLPPGLVEPATKVLSIAGNGPFGLFGPDLFGDAKSR